MLTDTTAQSAAAGALADALGFGNMRSDFMSAAFWGTPRKEIEGALFNMRSRDDMLAKLAAQRDIAAMNANTQLFKGRQDANDRWDQLVYKTNTETANERARNERMMQFYGQLGNRWNLDREQKNQIEANKESGRMQRADMRIDAQERMLDNRIAGQLANLQYKYQEGIPNQLAEQAKYVQQLQAQKDNAMDWRQREAFAYKAEIEADKLAELQRWHDIQDKHMGRRLDQAEQFGGRKYDLAELEALRRYLLGGERNRITEEYNKGKLQQGGRKLDQSEEFGKRGLALKEQQLAEQVAGREGKGKFLDKKLEFWQANEEANRMSREKIAQMKLENEVAMGANKLPPIASEKVWRESLKMSKGPDGQPNIQKAMIIHQEMLKQYMNSRGGNSQAQPQPPQPQAPQQQGSSWYNPLSWW